ncbi:MAG TPA: outer membrane protein assembly factor BamA [Rhizomicrobium sp.]
MKVNDLLNTVFRSAPALACLALCIPVQAAAPAPTPPATQAPPAPVQRTIQHIAVVGTQRIEPATVLSYVGIREGDDYDPSQVDEALTTLYATGLFSDVHEKFENGTLTWYVTENPIVNEVQFEGNSKVTDKDLTKEVEIKPRSVFTRARVQSDVQRIIELYRRNGKFAATVDPQIIQRPQNRVDLIFSIHDGPTTKVARIDFIGNKIFSDDTLRGQIATEESRWYKFLASNDNYDPDRLTFDREELRRYYISHGYADMRVVSATAQLTPDRENFYITFTIDEGDRYKFGKVEIKSKIKDLTPASLMPMVKFSPGDVYNAELIQKTIDALTNAAGTKGYAFAEVHPRVARNHDTHTADLSFDIEEGPRVYIEKINITGNTRTLDKVIRREFRLVEGDAFNRVLVDRSRTRIRALGFFKDVEVKDTPGSQPDRTNLTVAVTEQSTGSLSVGAGYSTTDSFIGEFAYTEQNLFGRGQFVRASVQVSQISRQFEFSFTEPYFLDRPLAAGFDLSKSLTDFEEADYEGDTTLAGIRFGFPISEYSSINLRYVYKIDTVYPFQGAALAVLESQGTQTGSIFGFTYGYNNLDDQIRPTTGWAFSFSQDFAGPGGSLKYLKTEAQLANYHAIFDGNVILSLHGQSGFISGYDGKIIPISERFFEGGDSFRGFALAGIGPRDILQPKDVSAVGGNAYAIGTLQTDFPNIVPASYGLKLGLFTDFGTLGRVDDISRICTATSCVKDNFAFRASAGISIKWKSPFGPIQIDLGLPIAQAKYDRAQIIHFTSATGS